MLTIPNTLPLLFALQTLADGRTAAHIAEERDSDGDRLRSAMTELLLRPALIAPDDMAPGWRLDPNAGGSPDPDIANDVRSVFIADLDVRLSHEESGDVVRQHVGILPRWALRSSHANAIDRPIGGRASRDLAVTRHGVVVVTIAFRAGERSSGMDRDALVREADQRCASLAGVLR